jgi:ribonuclease HI
VPQKLRIFAWKAATNSLDVRTNLNRRITSVDPVCAICGYGKEDIHHALVSCTLAVALRHGMRDWWNLPAESAFRDTGDEWFLNLLINVAAVDRSRIIFLLWRVWHHRNNIVHGDGKASVAASIPYLKKYFETFVSCTRPVLDAKGKSAFLQVPQPDPEGSLISKWAAPPEHSVKANVDAGWDAKTGRGGLGVVIRDHHGRVMLSEWKHIPYCSSAKEAEILACLEGMKHLSNVPCDKGIVESDCLRVVHVLNDGWHVLNDGCQDKSPCWCLYKEGHELLRIFRHICISKVDRVSNRVAHGLAHLGRQGEVGLLHGSCPTSLVDLVSEDCNPVRLRRPLVS